LFESWLLSKKAIEELVREQNTTRQTLNNWFKQFWKEEIKPKDINISNLNLIIDGKYLDRKTVCLIGAVNKKVVNWKFNNGENYLTWISFFLSLKTIPFSIVCDGQRGMLKAVKQLFPRVIIQRCQFHVIKYCLAKLTRNPESIAGQMLRLLVLDISKVKTKDDLDNWLIDFKDWYFNYENFLNEKTYSKTSFTKTNHPRWHYSHKNLHACFSHLKNALPYLFQYINHPTIPNTTNYLEGGINSQIQHLIVNHRGLNLNQRKYLISLFLSKKQ
jgi:hypothetical protein